MSTDLQGRLKVTNQQELFSYTPNAFEVNYIDSKYDGTFPHEWLTTIYFETDPSGLQTTNIDFSTDGNSMYINNEDGSGTGITRETKIYMPYKNGCSRITKCNVTPCSNYQNNGYNVSAATYRRIGLIGTTTKSSESQYAKKTPNEGIYFEVEGSGNTTDSSGFVIEQFTMSFVLNALSSTTVTQSNWNIDVFDGSGISGKTINTASLGSPMCIVIDENYGIGRVRVGFEISGVVYYAHQWTTENVNVYQNELIKTPYIPIAYQIYTSYYDASGGSTFNMKQLSCSSYLQSDNSISTIRNLNSVSTGTTGVALDASNEVVVLGIRLSDTYPYEYKHTNYISNIHRLVSLSGLYTNSNYNDDDVIEIKVYLHTSNLFNKRQVVTRTLGSITGSESYTHVENSMLEYYAGSGSQYINQSETRKGHLVGIYHMNKNGLNLTFENDQSKLLTRYDTMYITAKSTDTNTTVYMSASLQQI